MTRLTVAEMPQADGKIVIHIIFNVNDFLHICEYGQTDRVRLAYPTPPCIRHAGRRSSCTSASIASRDCCLASSLTSLFCACCQH